MQSKGATDLSCLAIEFGKDSRQWDLGNDLFLILILEQGSSREIKGEEKERRRYRLDV
jgi:hypothetical protein